jgi:hypothetical protein
VKKNLCVKEEEGDVLLGEGGAEEKRQTISISCVAASVTCICLAVDCRKLRVK